jgi:hypothetical protein
VSRKPRSSLAAALAASAASDRLVRYGTARWDTVAPERCNELSDDTATPMTIAATTMRIPKPLASWARTDMLASFAFPVHTISYRTAVHLLFT